MRNFPIELYIFHLTRWDLHLLYSLPLFSQYLFYFIERVFFSYNLLLRCHFSVSLQTVLIVSWRVIKLICNICCFFWSSTLFQVAYLFPIICLIKFMISSFVLLFFFTRMHYRGRFCPGSQASHICISCKYE